MRQGRSASLAKHLQALAVGCGVWALLTPLLVQGLALEEISVRSRIGQPLDASIPVHVAASETLDDSCFSVAAADDAVFPGIPGARARVDRARGQLILRSPSSVREPLSELTIRVRCRGLPALDRSFVVALDLPDARAASVFARADDPAASADTGAAERPAAVPAATTHAARVTPARATIARAEKRTAHAGAVVGPPAPARAKRPPAAAPAVAIEPLDVSVLPARLAPPEHAAPVVRAPAPPVAPQDSARTAAANESTGIAQSHVGDDVPVAQPAPARVAARDTASAAPARAHAEAKVAPAAKPAPTQASSSYSWIGWTLGALLAAALVAGIAAIVVRWRRRVAELDRAQSMRRASGLERTIRLDHGIIVKEHAAGTPLTVDASTQEIAAIRPRRPAHTATVKVVTLQPEPVARGGTSLLEFGTEAPGDVMFEIEPISELDLEFPEAAEQPALPDTSEVPTEVMPAATQRERLADSRQYTVDTDLMELAYREELANTLDPDATAKLEMPEATVTLETPDTLVPGETRRPEGSRGLESDALADTVLGEPTDSNVVALWNGVDEEEIAPAIETRARASKKS